MDQTHSSASHQRVARNKGKLIGARPPLRPKHVWSICTKLQVEGELRDLAMFNLAIDSKLRGCDLVSLRAADIAPNGYALERATVRQKKTPTRLAFEIARRDHKHVEVTYKLGAKRFREVQRIVGIIFGVQS